MMSEIFWKKYFTVYDILNKVIPYQNLIRETIDALEIKNGELILDAGCGTGNFTGYIQESGGNSVSVDSSKAAIDICRNKFPENKIIFADISGKLPFNDDTFDKIVCSLTFHVLKKEDQNKAILNFYRILKPGGKIVLVNPCTTFSPINIYRNHLINSIKNNGFRKTIIDVLLLLLPTLKMFYYNLLIEMKNKNKVNSFLDFNDQVLLLKKNGFKKISNTKKIYADSAILNSAYK